MRSVDADIYTRTGFLLAWLRLVFRLGVQQGFSMYRKAAPDAALSWGTGGGLGSEGALHKIGAPRGAKRNA